MRSSTYYIINAITLYRLLAAPVLLLLAIANWFHILKWMMALSFFTDAIDGYLARHNKVDSKLGARLDSIADDLTVLAGIIALALYRPQFIEQQFFVFLLVFLLFVAQAIMALVRYGKISSFHTYAAKLAAILQGVFLITVFFTGPLLPLFYVAAIVTAIQLVEEIILVFVLPTWKVNVKGLYWVLKNRQQA
ncbi:MAG: CDP-alcohol phosphatidyltransferase family protein [Chitinophagaceae bacterium]